MLCRVNQADRAQNYRPACQKFGVLCLKSMSCKCAIEVALVGVVAFSVRGAAN